MKQISMYKYMTYAYNEAICPRNDDFSHVTVDTLALQYSGVDWIIGNRLSFAPDHTLGHKSSIAIATY